MKKIAAYCLFITMLLCGTGVSALTYEPPYDTPAVSQHLMEQMPEPFSFDNLTKAEIASCDFDNAASAENLTAVSNQNYWNDEENAVVISKTQTTSPVSFVLRYEPAGGITEGEYYAFSCRIKTVGITGDAPKNILACYNTSAGSNKWLNEKANYGEFENVTGDTDWYEMVQYIGAPEGTTALNLQAYLPQKLTGTVYFDDFKLYRVAIDPLESVLRSPAYKGLIYGDGDGDIVLDVLIYESKSFFELESLSLTVQLLDADGSVIYYAEHEQPAEMMNFVFSSRGLANGTYYLKSVLKDKATGAVISEKEQTLCKRSADDYPENYVDENGHYMKNGEKVFFNRIYNYSRNGNSHYQEAAQFAKDTGIDTVANYGMWWAVGNQYADAFNFMRENNITSHMGFNAYYFSSRAGNEGKLLIEEQTDIPGLFSEVVSDFKNDAVLDGYYIFDEPDPYLVGEEIRWNNQILTELDADHPTFGVADKELDAYGIYTKMTDIIGVDPYPVTGKTDGEGNPTYDISKAGDAVAQIKKSFPNRPVYYVMQGFHYSSRGDLRSPSYTELKNMAWQAICEGAEGLDWYAYPEMINDSTKSAEQWKNEVSTLLSEIKVYEPIILSDEPVPNYSTSAGSDWLNLTLRRYNGKTYLFAVNHSFEAQHTTVSIDDLSPMMLSFAPLEVKQFAFEQEAYLPAVFAPVDY